MLLSEEPLEVLEGKTDWQNFTPGRFLRPWHVEGAAQLVREPWEEFGREAPRTWIRVMEGERKEGMSFRNTR